MNRTELIDAVSTDTGLTRQQAEAALEAIIYEVTAGVRGGNPVRITGFGTFKLRERKARRGRNPQTGAPVRVKASKGIGFTPGVKLKADLNSRGAIAKPKPAPAPRAAAVGARAVAKSAAPTRATAKKSTATKTAAKKTVAKKAATKTAPARMTAARSVAKRSTGRR